MEFLSDEKRSFTANRIFAYNRGRKIAFGLSIIIGALAIAAFVAVYALFLRDSDFFLIAAVNSAWKSISASIADSTLLGAFYTALIGGLFFVFMPLEVLFARFLGTGNPFLLVLLVFISGLVVSYTINYLVGMKLSGISKKIISPRKFYKTKNILNRYGAAAVYIFNALPLPSQPLAAILGVFRYNRTRFYVFFLLGQLTKYIVIGLGAHYF